MKKYSLYFLLLLPYWCVKAQDFEMTDKYIQAYFGMNQAAFSEHLSENVTWQDLTWSEIDPDNKAVSGKQSVLQHLQMATLF